MDIYINNAKLDVEMEETDSLDTIIECIEGFIRENGKIIEELLINGEEFEKNRGIAVDKISMIEVKVNSPRIIALESLREMDLYLERVLVGIDTIIDLLESDSEKEAMDIVVQLINGLEWIYNIFTRIEELTSIDYSELNFKDTFETYKEAMNSILESLENKDFIMLSDILNYELKDNIENISEILPDIYNFILEEEKKELNKC